MQNQTAQKVIALLLTAVGLFGLLAGCTRENLVAAPVVVESVPQPKPQAGPIVADFEAPLTAMLEVENILQNPQLRNGCEATCLAIALTYAGYPVDKETVAYEYLPSQAFEDDEGTLLGGDPERVYPGDPATEQGYYCFTKPVATAASRILAEHSADEMVWDVTGAGEEDLVQLIAKGYPVIAWTTTDGQAPYQSADLAWTLTTTGEVYIPYMNLHVVVLRGYDEDSFYLCDPLGNAENVDREAFMGIFEQTGAWAVVIGI